MDCFDFQSLKMQHTYSVLRPSIFHRYEALLTAFIDLGGKKLTWSFQVWQRVPSIPGCSI